MHLDRTNTLFRPVFSWMSLSSNMSHLRSSYIGDEEVEAWRWQLI